MTDKKLCCHACKRSFENHMKCRRCCVIKDVSFFQEEKMNKKTKKIIIKSFITCNNCRKVDRQLRLKKKINLNSV